MQSAGSSVFCTTPRPALRADPGVDALLEATRCLFPSATRCERRGAPTKEAGPADVVRIGGAGERARGGGGAAPALGRAYAVRAGAASRHPTDPLFQRVSLQ
jgi:hypothetical protein